VLKLERNSLEFLLKHYCGVAANKEYQKADWRIRPLPDVMKRYAREDTHYLLYIYDVMRMELHTMAKEDEQSDSPLVEVYKRSYDVCMQLYEKELWTRDSYLHVYGYVAYCPPHESKSTL
jgi:exosome complex exonuclease RRP6